MKEKYLKFCDYVARACGAFAVLALLLSILVIVELVFERYFFQRAITWQTELVTMLLVASTFIGSAYVLSEKAHVSMEWIYDFLSKKNILRLKIFTSLVSLLFFLILFYFGFLMVEQAPILEITKPPGTLHNHLSNPVYKSFPAGELATAMPININIGIESRTNEFNPA